MAKRDEADLKRVEQMNDAPLALTLFNESTGKTTAKLDLGKAAQYMLREFHGYEGLAAAIRYVFDNSESFKVKLDALKLVVQTVRTGVLTQEPDGYDHKPTDELRKLAKAKVQNLVMVFNTGDTSKAQELLGEVIDVSSIQQRHVEEEAGEPEYPEGGGGGDREGVNDPSSEAAW